MCECAGRFLSQRQVNELGLAAVERVVRSKVGRCSWRCSWAVTDGDGGWAETNQAGGGGPRLSPAGAPAGLAGGGRVAPVGRVPSLTAPRPALLRDKVLADEPLFKRITSYV